MRVHPFPITNIAPPSSDTIARIDEGSRILACQQKDRNHSQAEEIVGICRVPCELFWWRISRRANDSPRRVRITTNNRFLEILCVRINRETTCCLQATHEKEAQMNRRNKFPKGWNQDRVRDVLEHYENQTEDEAVAEDEAAFRSRKQAVMIVPKALVPAITKLISTHGNKRTRKAA